MNDSSHQCEGEKKEKKENREGTTFPWKILFLAVLGYGVVYLLFVLQIGPPAGRDLSNGEWLSFLGGYLSFVGSLIMSVMVYRQEKKLAQLTLKQNEFYLECAVEAVEYACNGFVPVDKHVYIPRKYEESEEYNDRYFFINHFQKIEKIEKESEDENCTRTNKEKVTLILSTALYCSHDATAFDVKVSKISLKRVETGNIIAEYCISDKHVKNRISQTHNELLLSHILPDFIKPEYGEYELVFDVSHVAFDDVKPNTVCVYMIIRSNGILIIDGLENPRIPIRDLNI